MNGLNLSGGVSLAKVVGLYGEGRSVGDDREMELEERGNYVIWAVSYLLPVWMVLMRMIPVTDVGDVARWWWW